MILNVSFPQAEVLPEALDYAGKQAEEGVDTWIGKRVSGFTRIGVLFQVCFILLAIRRLDDFAQTFDSFVGTAIVGLQWVWTGVLLCVSLMLTLKVLVDQLHIKVNEAAISGLSI